MSDALHIVIVDDFAELRAEMVVGLAQPGRWVTGAGSGRQLDALLRGHAFDIALLDVNLPGENGYAIAERLRARYPAMGLVMLTASPPRSDAPQVFDALLRKPVDLEALEAVIDRIASAAAPARAAQPPTAV